MKLLNLGCGDRLGKSWINVDLKSNHPCVQAHNLRHGIPYPDNMFDMVYHSHLLEHFARKDAIKFVQACYRVLKPGGVVRVIVPDLEGIVRLYLESLEMVSRGEEGWQHNYNWMMIELYDQVLREKSGGMVSEYTRQENIPNREFVFKRLGMYTTPENNDLRNTGEATDKPPKFKKRIRGHFKNASRAIRSFVLRLVLGKTDVQALKLGRFRLQGEVHLWMYDSYSLKNLLTHVGFKDARRMSWDRSLIPDWKSIGLDWDSSGRPIQGESLIMEAVK